MTSTPQPSEHAAQVSLAKRIQQVLTSDTTLYLVKRTLQALLTLLLASALSFFIIQLAPGDFLAQQRQNPEIS
ncbi:MAG: ABC transporter permease, partial [Cyanobacteria bacterium J06659_2]